MILSLPPWLIVNVIVTRGRFTINKPWLLNYTFCLYVCHSYEINQSIIPSFIPKVPWLLGEDDAVNASWIPPWGQRVFKTRFCSQFNVFWSQVAPAFTGDAVFPPPVIQIGLQSTGRFHWLGKKKGVEVCLSFWFFFFFFLFRKRKEKPVQKRVGTAVLIPAIVQPPREAHTQASEPFGIFSNMQRLSTGIKARDTHTVSQGTQKSC